jgi:hypothetical protein
MKQLFIISLLFVPGILAAQEVESTETTETTVTSESRTEVEDAYINETKTDDIGMGVFVGGPTTVTGKYWLNEINAIDFGAAFSDDDYAILGTYLHHFEGTNIGRRMAPYVGFGFYVDFDQEQTETVFDRDAEDDTGEGEIGFGLRIPVGLEYLPENMPIGIFAEISPGMSLTPDTDGFVTAGAGARFYW